MKIGKDKIAGYYANHLWDKEQVAAAVECGEITAEEYKEITDEDYAAPTKPLTAFEQAALDAALGVEYLIAIAELGQ